MKYARYFDSFSKAIRANDLVSPNISLIEDELGGGSKLLIKQVGEIGTPLQLTGDSLDDLVIQEKVIGPAANEIWYTASEVVTPCDTRQLLGENDAVLSIESNEYDSSKGVYVMRFSGDLLKIGNANLRLIEANGVFFNKTALTSIQLPEGLTSIGSSAFQNCSSLTSITIPDSVTSIGDSAFDGCSSLNSVTIGNSVTSIGNSAFSGCSGLTSITVDSNNTVYDSRNNCNAIIKTSTNELIVGCKNTTIPDSVTSIRWNAFNNCTGLTSVTIPDSVTSIGSNAFNGCTGLTSIEIPDSVTSISNYAFSSCSGLTSVTIPDSVTSISNYAFSGCSGLTSVTIPDSVTSIGESAFRGCSGLTRIDTTSQTVADLLLSTYVGYTTSYPVYLNDVYYGDTPSYCCFVAGTQIQMEDGTTKNIEDIQIGDRTISYNPEINELETTIVKNTIIHENTTTLARVTLENDLVVEMNEYHPILTRNGWHSITNHEGYDTLVIGDEVKTLNGYSTITNIERWINDPILTYNLDVVDEHDLDRDYDNYFANGMCVHNRANPCGISILG